MLDLGFNYRLTDLQAALGISQMARLSENISKRNKLVTRYGKILDKTNLLLPKVSDGSVSAFHLYIVRLKDPKCRAKVFRILREKGIGVNVHYIPVHLQPYYRDLGFKLGDYPNAEDYYARAISIPMFPELTTDEQDYIAATLNGAVL